MAELLHNDIENDFGSVGDIPSRTRARIKRTEASGDKIDASLLWKLYSDDDPQRPSRLIENASQNIIQIAIQGETVIEDDFQLPNEVITAYDVTSTGVSSEPILNLFFTTFEDEDLIGDLEISIQSLNENKVYKEFPEASEIALRNAQSSISIIRDKNLEPLKPQRTIDGGIMIEFPKPQKITFIEFENDGEIFLGYIDENNEESYLETDIDNLGLHLKTYKGKID